MPSLAQLHSIMLWGCSAEGGGRIVHAFSPRCSLCYLGREAPSWEVRGPSSLAEFPHPLEAKRTGLLDVCYVLVLTKGVCNLCIYSIFAVKVMR